MSFAEISTALNIDQPTLKVQASRGIAKLRDILQKAGVAISSSALSSVLIESSFQKAPANISFHKNPHCRVVQKLEQVFAFTMKKNYPH
jgi:sugar phosphate isomerase/epimerase